MLEVSGDTADTQPGVLATPPALPVSSFLLFGLLLSFTLSWSLSLSPVLEDDSGGEVEEVEVLGGSEENPLSLLLRLALVSLFDPKRTANGD